MRSLFAFSAACRHVIVIAASIGFCLFGAAARDARADIIVALPGFDPSEIAGGFLWEYDVELAPGQVIRAGAKFTIYDFAGFLGELTTVAPDDWLFSTTVFTPTPLADASCPDPNDDSCNPNPPDGPTTDLTWTYMGPDEFTGGSWFEVFAAGSAFGYDTAVDAWFAGLAYADSTSTVPLVFNSAEGTEVPSAPEVPEPGSMLLLASGLFGAAAMIRRRQAAQL